MTAISTIYGAFQRESKHRLDLTYFYEHHQISGLKEIAKLVSPERFIDIGANIGVYAIFLSSLDSIRNVDAFEPTPDAFSLLRSNIGEQNHNKISLHKVALSDQPGTAQFKIFGDLAGNNSIAETSLTQKLPEKMITVQRSRLDQIFTISGERFVAKIDVEGHEASVVKGAKEYLTKNSGVLQVECFENNRDELEKLLRSYGYNLIFRLKDDLYFSNIDDDKLQNEIVSSLYNEVAAALEDLKQMKIVRQRTNWTITEALRISRGSGDPVIIN